MKTTYIVQSSVLLAGTLFSWTTVVQNFIRFYISEGTIFKIQNCSVPNPVTQSCFYGAIGFLVAFLLSLFLMRLKGVRAQRAQMYLLLLLSAGTVFAWYNVAREFFAFYRTGTVVGCSAVVLSNPYTSPCFTGATFFLVAAIYACVLYVQRPAKTETSM